MRTEDCSMMLLSGRFGLHCAVSFIACLLLVAPPVQSRPEVIRAGMKYYSDEYFEDGLVRDLDGEKNYEEIYQHYTYYEAIYDSLGRVTVFKEFKQGAVILEERYRYVTDPPGVERTVLLPGKPPQVTRAAEHTIGMEGWEFDPVELSIRVGDTVVWHNNDDTAHNIAFEIEFDDIPTMDRPRKVRMDERWAFTFDRPGVYKYTCKIHRNYDMHGVIVVEE